MRDEELLCLLGSISTVAVVGASTNSDKASSKVPAILIGAGYTVIPVHPTATEILGRRAYPSLADIDVQVDVVDVFRPPQEAPAIAELAAAIGARVLWLQLGITSPDAKRIAEQAGMIYLEDICIGATTARLGAHPR